MRKVLNIIAFLIIAGVAAVYFVFGPSALIGGPKTSDIVDVSRAVMVKTASSTALADAAETLEITPKGLCSHNQDGSYACAVEMKIGTSEPTIFIAVLKKGADGVWIAAE